MKKNKVTFTCDNCEEEISVEGESKRQKFPYEKGWIFMYNLEWKRKNPMSERPIKDKHFCCKECAIQFVEKEFKKTK